MPLPSPHQLFLPILALFTAPLLLGVTASAGTAPVPRDALPPPDHLAASSPSGLPAAPARASPRFTWPLAPPHPVLRPFDAPSSPYGPGHRGVDLGGSVGEPVLAAADGVVVYAGQLAGRGVVSVAHANGLRTTYEPVTPVVRAGRRVAAGAVLGHLRPGHAGCAGAPACLHWGVRRGPEYLDPLTLLAPAGRVRLLPWKEVPAGE